MRDGGQSTDGHQGCPLGMRLFRLHKDRLRFSAAGLRFTDSGWRSTDGSLCSADAGWLEGSHCSVGALLGSRVVKPGVNRRRLMSNHWRLAV